jgi:hypothetical protein
MSNLKMLKHAEELEDKYFAENSEYHKMNDLGEKMRDVLYGQPIISFTYDHNWNLNSDNDLVFEIEVGTLPEDHVDNPKKNHPEISEKELNMLILELVKVMKDNFPSAKFDLKKLKDKFNPKLILKKLIFTVDLVHHGNG